MARMKRLLESMPMRRVEADGFPGVQIRRELDLYVGVLRERLLRAGGPIPPIGGRWCDVIDMSGGDGDA